jgi:TetR/AcrR family transcriptional regulator, transcriptional repressor for nem operon
MVSQELGTRYVILELAQDLLRERGYNGFSYGQIAEKLDVKPAAIHYYFPSKESLGQTLVQRERRRFKKMAARLVKDDVRVRLDWFLNIYEHYSLGGTRVCYLGALESGYGELPASIKTEVKFLNKEMLDWLTGLLREGKAKNAFAFKGEPEDKAALILGALQGAIQIARVSSPHSLHAVMRQIKAELK